VVSCLPVLVLGMGAALAHLLRAGGGPGAGQRSGGPVLAGLADGDAGAGRVVRSGRDRLSVVRSGRDRPPMVRSGASARLDRSGAEDCGPVPVVVWSGHAGAVRGDGGPARTVPGQRGGAGRLDGRARLAEARAAAVPLAAAGERVSRRALRAAGLRGSNADLGALARILTAEYAAGGGT
jgi:hypothetical protein